MLKFQILSFGQIGASLTVIVAFLVNYFMSLVYEYVIYNNIPNMQQFLGCLLVFIGINALRTSIIEKCTNPEREDQENPFTVNLVIFSPIKFIGESDI